jgi:hypothetical protein
MALMRPSVPPSSFDDRRVPPSVAHASIAADSSRDVAQEDFLFHLYRGSELLQENRVLEAKEELEFALTMQPLDAKGQDLLGAVYFRLGLYPRAIQIYENLAGQFPRDASVKINLALCYLKTGQPEAAKGALQEAVRINPEHKRAWGYLGLALQKLGELESAQIAFERGGHSMMAKRMTEKRRTSVPPPAGGSAEIDEGVRSVAETAFSELDAGELRFALAEPHSPKPTDGDWHTLELGDAGKTRSAFPKTLPPPPVHENEQNAHEAATVMPPSSQRPPPRPLRIGDTLTTLAATRLVPPAPAIAVAAVPVAAPRAEEPRALLDLPPGRGVALRTDGVLVARTNDEAGNGFAARLDALRVVAGAVQTRVLHRRVRNESMDADPTDTNEVLGGIGSPFVRISGDAAVALGARPTRELALIELTDDIAFVREEALLGFELRLAYENGRVALEDNDGTSLAPVAGSARPQLGTHLVQLRGAGAVVLELGGPPLPVACTGDRPVLVRREWLIGWIGRLVPRALRASESPGGQRGVVRFSGEGTILVTTK